MADHLPPPLKGHRTHKLEGHDCPTCGHRYKGRVCSLCGEKAFKPTDLSLGHIVKEAVDVFTHLDLKIPRSIGKLFVPGYLTQRYLQGIRVPYAKPLQLFFICNLVFFFVAGWIGFTDFNPHFGDHTYNSISDPALMRWFAPAERTWDDAISQTGANKAYALGHISAPDQALLFNENWFKNPFMQKFHHSSGVYGRTFIILLVPLSALLIFVFWRKHFQYGGAAVIFATHFISFYMLAFCIMSLFNYTLERSTYAWLSPFHYLIALYTWEPLTPLLDFVFGSSFSYLHMVLFVPYLFLAFKRLFAPAWWANLFASFWISRILFYLLFGVYKKLLTMLVVWLM
jgi:Protein of unknown function (DUF3667)